MIARCGLWLLCGWSLLADHVLWALFLAVTAAALLLYEIEI